MINSGLLEIYVLFTGLCAWEHQGWEEDSSIVEGDIVINFFVGG